MPAFSLPKLSLPKLSLPKVSIPKAQPTTVAGSAALGVLAYNLAVVFFPLPELRIATTEALTLGLGAVGATLLAARPRFRAAAVYSTIGVAVACLFAGVWYAGKTGTPLPRLGLDFLTSAGLAWLALPLQNSPRIAKA
jgi:hypothetical protein